MRKILVCPIHNEKRVFRKKSGNGYCRSCLKGYAKEYRKTHPRKKKTPPAPLTPYVQALLVEIEQRKQGVHVCGAHCPQHGCDNPQCQACR